MISCTVCLSDYDDEFHIPKALQCGHTFCLMCVQSLTNENISIKCPQCRHITDALIFRPLTIFSLVKVQRRRSTSHVSKNLESDLVIGIHACEHPNLTAFCCYCKDLVCEKCKLFHQEKFGCFFPSLPEATSTIKKKLLQRTLEIQQRCQHVVTVKQKCLANLKRLNNLFRRPFLENENLCMKVNREVCISHSILGRLQNARKSLGLLENISNCGELKCAIGSVIDELQQANQGVVNMISLTNFLEEYKFIFILAITSSSLLSECDRGVREEKTTFPVVALDTVTDGVGGLVTFSEISFTERGIHVYRLRKDYLSKCFFSMKMSLVKTVLFSESLCFFDFQLKEKNKKRSLRLYVRPTTVNGVNELHKFCHEFPSNSKSVISPPSLLCEGDVDYLIFSYFIDLGSVKLATESSTMKKWELQHSHVPLLGVIESSSKEFRDIALARASGEKVSCDIFLSDCGIQLPF